MGYSQRRITLGISTDWDIDRFRLDPSKFPNRGDVFVPGRVMGHIQEISARMGRSFAKSAAVILA